MSWALIRTFQWTLSFIKPKPNEATPIVPTPPSNNKTIVIFGATGKIRMWFEQFRFQY
jgi:hypothetical protein